MLMNKLIISFDLEVHVDLADVFFSVFQEHRK